MYFSQICILNIRLLWRNPCLVRYNEGGSNHSLYINILVIWEWSGFHNICNSKTRLIPYIDRTLNFHDLIVILSNEISCIWYLLTLSICLSSINISFCWIAVPNQVNRLIVFVLSVYIYSDIFPLQLLLRGFVVLSPACHAL